MKMKLLSVFGVVIVSLVIGCASLGLRSSGALKPYRSIKLENGLNVLFVNDEKLPYISFTMVFLSGFTSDSKNQTGLTAATMDLLNKGTKNKNATQIANEIEQMGADYSVDVSADYSMISLDGLSWQEDKLLSIFSEMLFMPKFENIEINRYKSKTTAVVQQRLDQASYLASEIFDGFYYKNHPYAQRDIGSLTHIKSLNKKAIETHYNKIIRPNNAWLVVVGKYSSDIDDKISKIFGSWKGENLVRPDFPAVEEIGGRKILLVNKSDAAQAEIRIGHKGTDRRSPEHLATNIANSILGQGFTSRLVDRIRDQLGLTYSINSSTDYKLNASVFEIRTFTQNEKVGQMIKETLAVYEDFHKNGVTKTELEVAKNYMSGVFPSLVETAEKTALNLMILRVFGVSDEYLLNYQKNIAKVTLAQVNDSIRKNFDPKNLKIVILAQKNKVEPQLKDLGDLQVVEASTFLK